MSARIYFASLLIEEEERQEERNRTRQIQRSLRNVNDPLINYSDKQFMKL